MTTKKLTLVKIISLICVACFLSCSLVSNKGKLEGVVLKKTILDFIEEYNKINNKEQLEALTIYIDKDGILNSLSISDLPKAEIYNLNEKHQKLIGKYQNFEFEIYGIENLKSNTIINDSDLKLKPLKKDNQQIVLEYNPNLQIEYKFKKKIIRNNEIKTEKWIY